MKRILLCLLLFSAGSCDSTFRSSIPNSPVYLELDLTFEDKDLVAGMAYKAFTAPRKASEYIGFGGILVYHGLPDSRGDEYFAFDLACPFEASRSVKVEVDEDHIYAICPKCQTTYELVYGIANPVSGTSKESLKRYTLWKSGNNLFVRNN
ncbi:hypothetical protein FACS189416_1550 [Bacteroidia bacterium]|nr:hypothetical protein FACS189416_1550 [Bacteroidia bacterium]